jgi:hypothetical protein
MAVFLCYGIRLLSLVIDKNFIPFPILTNIISFPTDQQPVPAVVEGILFYQTSLGGHFNVRNRNGTAWFHLVQGNGADPRIPKNDTTLNHKLKSQLSNHYRKFLFRTIIWI